MLSGNQIRVLNEEFEGWRRLNRQIDRVLLIVLLVLLAIACAGLLGDWRTQSRGVVKADPRDFKTLLAINGDTVAWLMLEDTPIDHPVVQGKDNYEYLDKAFDGRFYAGGTLFLDAANDKTLSDSYNIIHGHHMAGRAMFSSLERFLEKDYFDSHQTGTLLTPKKEYDLRLLAAGVYDAYDGRVYAPGQELPLEAMRESKYSVPGSTGGIGRSVPGSTGKAEHGATGSTGENGHSASGSTGAERQILALSTCSGEMNDNRIVVFWGMTERRKR